MGIGMGGKVGQAVAVNTGAGGADCVSGGIAVNSGAGVAGSGISGMQGTVVITDRRGIRMAVLAVIQVDTYLDRRTVGCRMTVVTILARGCIIVISQCSVMGISLVGSKVSIQNIMAYQTC